MQKSRLLSELPKEICIDLAKDILSHSRKLDLDYYSESSYPFDLWQKNEKGQVDLIVHTVEPSGITIKSIEQFVNNLMDTIDLLKPKEYILIDYSSDKSQAFDKISSILKNNKRSKFSYFSVNWIQEQLSNFQDLVTKFNIRIPEPEIKSIIKKGDGKSEISNKRIERVNAQLKEFFKLERNFYVGAHIWDDNNDQFPRFIEKKIWENGYNDKNIQAINSARKRDVILLKSIFKSGNENFLRIKGIGVITDNRFDGHLLKVNWFKFENPERVDIEKLGTYNKTFQKVSKENVLIVMQELIHVFPNLLEIIHELNTTINVDPTNNDITKTFIDNDGAFTSQDLLDIENDVRSFALILASKEIKPPLAIALFGKWGSGKSFFMSQLSKRVDELSINQGFLEEGDVELKQDEKSEEISFCKGIAQIKFNAWSYLDANLWAGLVTNIFEKLDEYITGDNVIEKEKSKVHNKVCKSLEIVQYEKSIISKEINELNNDKSEIEKSIESLVNEKDEFYTVIIKKSIEELKIEAKENTVDIEQAVRIQLDNYGISQQRIDELSPDALLDEVSSWVTFFKNIGKFNKRNALLAIVIFSVLLFLIFDPGGYLLEYKKFISLNTNLLIGVGGSIFAKVYSSYSNFKKVLNPVIQYKNKFNNSFEKVKLEYEKNLSMLTVKVSQKEQEIKTRKNELTKLNFEIDKYEYELKHSITKRAFNNFIQRKTKDENYAKHIGLISIIRKDFETLSALFEEITIPEYISEKEQEQISERKKENDEFRGYFKKPLDRIILYIDDLDRCSDEKVLEVIQAVHLLMAFPLFNVVVGVDKRCVNNALIYKNLLQYSKFAELDKIEDVGIHVISPGEYLEKIFQIPFQLDDPSDESIKGMVNSILESQIELEKIDEDEPQFEPVHKSHSFKQSRNDEVLMRRMPADKFDNASEMEVTPVQSSKRHEPETKVILKPKTITPKDLKLTKLEITLIEEIACLVGCIPRTIKRFINIYRIIRSHQDLNYDESNKRKEFLAIMFILAIYIGQYKKHAPAIMEAIGSNKNKNLDEIFNFIKVHNIIKTEFQSDLDIISKKIETSNDIRELLQYSGGQFIKHIAFVGRFSFGNVENGNYKESNTN